MDKNKLNHNADRGSNKQQQLYLNIAFFGVFACAALIFLLLAFDKIPPVSDTKKQKKKRYQPKLSSRPEPSLPHRKKHLLLRQASRSA